MNVIQFISENWQLVIAILGLIAAQSPPGSLLHRLLEILKVVKPVPPQPVDPTIPVVPDDPTINPSDRPIINAIIKALPIILPKILPLILPLLADQANRELPAMQERELKRGE